MSQKSIKKQEGNLLNYLIFRFLPYWHIFLLALAGALVSARFYLNRVTPLYSISASIIINDEKKGVDGSDLMESINTIDSKKIVENEIEVIRSREVMGMVVSDLKLDTPIYDYREQGSVPLYNEAPVRIEIDSLARGVPDENDEIKIPFSYSSSTKVISFNDKNYELNAWVPSTFGRIKFLPNKNTNKSKDGNYYFKVLNKQNVINDLINTLELSTTDKLSTVVMMEMVDAIPARGEDIIDNIISAYNIKSINDRNRLAASTMEFIEDRMLKVEKELNELETDIQDFRSEEGAYDLSVQSKQYLQDLGQNDTKIAETEVQLAVLDRVQTLIASENLGFVPSSVGIDDPVLSKLLEKLQDAEIQYESLKKTIAKNNPILTGLEDEITKIRANILENIANQESNLRAQVENLYRTSGRFDNVLKTIPIKERRLIEISRKEEIKNELFSFLLKKREETALSYGTVGLQSRVIDRAEASMLPTKPKPLIIYVVAAFSALLLGVLYVLLREVFTNNILFRYEIENLTSIPVVAEIPYLKSDYDKIMAKRLHDLRITLGLYGPSAKSAKKIIVASGNGNDGKTFIIKALAENLARSNQKTLLIDFNLSNPQLSKVLKADGESGLVDLLQDPDTDLSKYIKPTGQNNLFIIPAGKISQQSKFALLDGNLGSILTVMEKAYDYILIDAPAVNKSKDAHLISSFCDIILLIVRHRNTQKEEIAGMEALVEAVPKSNSAIVFNGVSTRGLTNKNTYGYEIL
ncbi:MAG: GNVR domain-containing protein [Leeuwenhoekiella sp.]